LRSSPQKNRPKHLNILFPSSQARKTTEIGFPPINHKRKKASQSPSDVNSTRGRLHTVHQLSQRPPPFIVVKSALQFPLHVVLTTFEIALPPPARNHFWAAPPSRLHLFSPFYKLICSFPPIPPLNPPFPVCGLNTGFPFFSCIQVLRH